MVMGDMELTTETLVVGGGPGGYTAAFRAAELGQEVTLVDSAARLGGVCLHSGCIPSKTLLGLAELIVDAQAAEKHGVLFARPQLDLPRIRSWKQSAIDDLAGGLLAQCKRRGVELLGGSVVFEDRQTVRLEHSEIRRIRFRNCIIATGSEPIPIAAAGFAAGSRVMDSEAALRLAEIPDNLLIIGGGYVGLELGTVFTQFGSKVTVVEREPHLLAGVDRDLVKPLEQRLISDLFAIRTDTGVVEMTEKSEQVLVKMQADGGTVTEESFDRVLVAVGRRPRSGQLALAAAGVQVDGRGFIHVDEQQRSTVKNIYAVGDVAGGMMLAHKAMREGRVAAEVISGLNSAFDVRAIPAVIYTDPQLAWCGLTEEQAAREQIAIEVRKLPWKYSGRARMLNVKDGLTKLILDPQTGRVLGGGITGKDAENLIAEIALAVEMGALAEDLALCMHPHPTLSESIADAAALFARHRHP